MDGLAEYIRWLGRFSFDELPFMEADALILCVISYFDLTPALADGAKTVAECMERFEDGFVRRQITGGDMGNSEIFRAAMESHRFGELTITEYEDILRPETPLQFAALTLRYGDRFGFIAFRGTDETIAGWREDFMISFTETEAQRLAAAYAERVIAGGGRYYIGGHSKGGNLALYAASRLSDGAWDRVERVYVLDGPGLCPEVMDTAVVRRIDPKTTRIIPEFSVVGRLFEPKVEDTRIVRSFASGILQHSLATWAVDHGGLALAPENDRRSVTMMHIMNRWIEGMSTEGRRAVTDDLFDALAAGGAVYLSDIAGSGPGGFEAVLVKMFHARPETKKLMLELPALAAATLREQLRLPAEV